MLTYLPPITKAVLLLIVITAGIYDLRYRRIPNWLVLAGVLVGLALNLLLFGLAGLERGTGAWTGAFDLFPLISTAGHGRRRREADGGRWINHRAGKLDRSLHGNSHTRRHNGINRAAFCEKGPQNILECWLDYE